MRTLIDDDERTTTICWFAIVCTPAISTIADVSNAWPVIVTRPPSPAVDGATERTIGVAAKL